jgi:hypothetical protein
MDGPQGPHCRYSAHVHSYKCILTKGYANTSLSDLARRSGLTGSHLLRYFPSKQAVLEKLCREFLGDYQPNSSGIASSRAKSKCGYWWTKSRSRSAVSFSALGGEPWNP